MEHMLLETIQSPADVKELTPEQLPQLAAELRETILTTVGTNGGHLASNLGAVELTIALHRVFHSPEDKIIWDVGHQAYAHKLLTGRYERFHTLRRENGISGFTRPTESEHDIVYSGHSSTAISTALGIAAANTVSGKKNYAVAVVGDGALTGGLVYEALNNAGRMKDARLIIILNDNGMSISGNVGHLAKNLAVMRSRSGYFRMKAAAERAISKLPLIGRPLANRLFKLKTDVKNMIYQSNFFEDMGVRYMGPIDGHNIAQLCDALEGAKLVHAPVLLHINTVKGKGYAPAEERPSEFHGVPPFDVETGTLPEHGTTYSERFGEFLFTQAAKDKRICAITAAMSLGTGLKKFSETYPERFFDVGIAEEHALPYALGLAKSGMRPVFVVYSTFLQRCYDEILHDCALQQSKMIIAVDRAGIVGEDGETHNGLFDTSFFNGVPNIAVWSPCTYAELDKCFVNALYHSEGPAVIRYPRGAEPAVPADFEVTGNAYDVYGDPNADIAIVTYGRLFVAAADAVARLKEQGVNVKILKLNRIVPIAATAYEELDGVKAVYFFEEAVRSGGIGESFGSYLLEHGLSPQFRLTAIPNGFVKQGKAADLLAEFGLDSDGMVRAVKEGAAHA